MESEQQRVERIRTYLFEASSEGDRLLPEDNVSQDSDNDEEEDHVSLSEHNTESHLDSDSEVDDTDDDPNYIPDSSEEDRHTEDHREGDMMDVEEGESSRVVEGGETGELRGSDTVDVTIEDVVRGAGGENYAVSNIRDRARNYFLGNDKKTHWKKTANVSTNVRTRSINIVTHVPGPIRNSKEAKTALECFSLFIDDQIVHEVVTNTNLFINNISHQFGRERDCKETDNLEMKSFFGLLIFAGSIRSGHQNLLELWKRDGTGLEIFYGTMCLRRFNFLLQSVRFDNVNDRNERRALDKFAPFRNVFEMFRSHCVNNFSVGEYATIDEQLVAFRGRCAFRQYMKSKPAKYGLKIFTLADAKVFYVKNMEVYVGKQPNESPYELSNKPEDVVLRLVSCIENSGRNITADNWFTSIPLVNKLIEKKLSYVGTVRKNKPELPLEMTNKKREAYSSVFGFKENVTLVSYAPKKDRSVVLVSTMHHSATIDPSTTDKKKPEIITFYNMTKSGVDMVDEKCGTYSTSRRTNRWPLALFYRLLDIAGINAQVIFMHNNVDSKIPRRLFLKEVAIELIKPQALRRSSIQSLPRIVRRSAMNISHGGPQRLQEQVQNPDPIPGRKQRCVVCPRNKDIKVKTCCASCKSPMCMKHMKSICERCIGNEEDSSD